MNEADRDLNAESWAFALQIYAEPGVAAACLQLQADAGVDVMLLLVAAFASARGVVVSPAEIEQMDSVCRPWREHVVQSLRALRTALKSGPAPAPGPHTETLRSQIKTSELAAERLQSDLLTEWVQPRIPTLARAALERPHAVIRDVVTFFAQRGGRQMTEEVITAIDVIAAAARRIPA